MVATAKMPHFEGKVLPPLKDVYKGKSVLITGASGFLGKVLVEKLLYSMNDVANIFVIIRSSKGVAPAERWCKITQNVLFDRVRNRFPERLNKVVVLEGDLEQPNLDLSDADQQRIFEEVNIVFHCAATVKFDENLRDAISMNVIGTVGLIAICKKIKNLKVLVHCSTAYANCELARTQEKVYKSQIEPRKILDAMEWMNDSMVDAITPSLLETRPNTYTFTKALAENQLLDDAKGLPVIIFRPSIVTAMWKDQLPGWIDNMNGPTGLLTAVGKGVLTNMCGDVRSKADLIPVDVVSNMMIACASYRMNIKTDEVPVVHCTSGVLNPLEWDFVVTFLEQMYHEHPMEQCFGVVSTYFHRSRLMFELNHRFKHELPAKLADWGCKLTGQRAIYSRLYGKVRIMVHTLEFFTTRGWTFESDNLVRLWDIMQPADKAEFNFDIRQLDWGSYLFDYVMGVKKYITNEKIGDQKALAAAKSNHRNRQRMRFLTRILLCYLFARMASGNVTKSSHFFLYFVAAFLTSQYYSSLNYRPVHRLKSLSDYLAQQKTDSAVIFDC